MGWIIVLLKTKDNIPHVLEMVIDKKQNISCSFLKIYKISLKRKWNKMKKMKMTSRLRYLPGEFRKEILS